MFRHRIGALAGAAALAVVVALPAAASTQLRTPISDDVTFGHACGIVEHLHVEGTATGYFAADGSWIRDVVHVRYSSTFESTITGRTMFATSRQTTVFTPDTITSSGQGFFVRVGGALLVLDAGHLQSDWDGNVLFASAKVIPGPFSPQAAAADAALCDALG